MSTALNSNRGRGLRTQSNVALTGHAAPWVGLVAHLYNTCCRWWVLLKLLLLLNLIIHDHTPWILHKLR